MIGLHGFYLERLEDGGYVITRPGDQPGMMSAKLYACTTIDEAFKYLRDYFANIEDMIRSNS